MIHISCALKCEAGPLVDFFRLTHHSQSSLFPVYVNQEQEISLTITGVGKLSAAAAAVHTHALFGAKTNDIWLNVGVAGHRDYAIGAAFLAHRIEDADSGQCWYPQIVIDTKLPSADLLSLSQPCTDYCEQLYDMEAAGFYHSVSRIGTAELCHSIKLVSDNQANPAHRLTGKAISQLLADKLEVISGFITQLRPLASELGRPDIAENFSHITGRWHFTHYQKKELERLLQRWQLLLPDASPLDGLASRRHAGDVLQALAHELEAAPLSYVVPHV